MITQIGKYQIERELAIGGFGRVYRGRDEAVGRLVALKVLSSAADESTLARFSQEAAAAGNLHHPNIVTIYEFGTHDGLPFLAMEYLEGRILQEAIAGKPPLTMLEKVRVLRQIADGVGHAHQSGIVHRDIKPSNIMILADGSVKIMDFGIARVSRQNGMRLTQAGDLIGTLLYMSPEQFRNIESDSLSDIFAVGIVAYELISGTHPFFAQDTAALMYRVTNEEPKPVCEGVPDCPPGLDAIVRRALAKDRHLRYQSLRDLVYDLEPLLRRLENREAKRLLDQAQANFIAGNLPSSEALLAEVLTLDPANTAARVLRSEIQSRELQSKVKAALANGKAHFAEKRWAEAVADFGLAARLDSSSSEAAVLLTAANAEVERSKRVSSLVTEARRLLASGDAAQAAARAEQACGLGADAEGGQEVLDEARAELARRQSGAELRRAVSKARGFSLIGEFERAQTLLDQLDETANGDASVIALRARLVALRKKEEHRREAEAILDKARELIRDNELQQALDLLESSVLEHEQSATLQQHLLRGIRQKLDDVREQDNRGRVKARVASLIEKEDFSEAADTLEIAISQAPDDPEWQPLLKRAVAVQVVLQNRLAIAAEYKMCEQLAAQGEILQAAGRAEAAKLQWPDADDFPNLLNRLRSSYDKVREIADADRSLESSKAELGRGHRHVAIAILENALERSPENPQVMEALAKARELPADKTSDVENGDPAQEKSTGHETDPAPLIPNLIERATNLLRGFFR